DRLSLRRFGLFHLACQLIERALSNGGADPPHQVEVEVEVVVGGQDGGGDFPGVEQVPQVGARVAPADGAGAARVQGARVAGIGGVADVQAPRRGEQVPVAGVAGGQHAVHHVHAASDILDQM